MLSMLSYIITWELYEELQYHIVRVPYFISICTICYKKMYLYRYIVRYLKTAVQYVIH